MFDFGTYGYIAEKDLKCAEKNLSIGEYNAVGVYSQQALEKIAKHYIQRKFIVEDIAELMRSRKLRKLYSRIKSYVDIKNEMEVIYALTDCYFDTRYPSENYFELDSKSAERYLESAKLIFERVREKILTLDNCSISESEEFK